MKILKFCLLVLFLKSAAFAAEGDGEAQIISNAKSLYGEVDATLSVDVKIEKLGGLLRVIGSPELYKVHRDEVELLRQKIQNDIIAIPGHAIYFSKKIKEEQERVKDLPLRSVPGRIEYNANRYSYISKVLANIPSPEAVQVLGGFLWDEKDNHPVGPNDDWGPIESNGNLAGLALSKIGLRNPPVETKFGGSPTEFQIWRTWYEEIKSGKRSFSFKGQNVEYRFNPDGSVATTPIKVEEQPTPAPSKSDSVQQAPVPNAASPARWPWLIAALITAGLVVAVKLWRKDKKSHPDPHIDE